MTTLPFTRSYESKVDSHRRLAIPFLLRCDFAARNGGRYHDQRWQERSSSLYFGFGMPQLPEGVYVFDARFIDDFVQRAEDFARQRCEELAQKDPQNAFWYDLFGKILELNPLYQRLTRSLFPFIQGEEMVYGPRGHVVNIPREIEKQAHLAGHRVVIEPGQGSRQNDGNFLQLRKIA